MKFEIDKLEAFLQDYAEQKKVPGMSVCVNGPEGTLYKKGFGFRDLEKTKPVDTETIFGIASMSKSITCCCLSILESEGKLSFQDPAYKYLPALRIPGTPREALLIHHLATMTSGIPPLPTLYMSIVSHTKFGPWLEPGAIELGKKLIKNPISTVDEIIDFISNNDDYEPLGAPGEYMSYSNDCYAMLSSIVDIASVTTLEQFAHDRIFAPLGMTHTAFDLDEAKAMGNITSIFVAEKDQLYCTDDWDTAPPYRGCGWVKSTSEDMSRYYEMLSCGGVFRGKRILPEGCAERLFGRIFPETTDGAYCYGLSKRIFHDTVIVDHSGGLTGVSSRGGFFKGQGYAATVLMNQGNIDPGVPFNAICNALLGLPLDTSHIPYSPQGDVPEEPKMYVGTYISKESFPPGEIVVSLNGAGELCAKMPGGTLHSVTSTENKLLLCDTTRFAVDDGQTPIGKSPRITFFVRNGKAWAVQSGSRMFQRDED